MIYFSPSQVQNNLTEEQVVERAASLNFPNSVIEYFQGYLGIPPMGFPEPLRSRVLEGKSLLPNGKNCFTARPGAEMKAYDFEGAKQTLEKKFGHKNIQEKDVVSYSQYPKVFDDFMVNRIKYSDLSILDTRTFVEGMYRL